MAASQDCGGALRDTREDVTKRIIERNDRLSAVLALAGGEHDRVVADVRPGEPQQITKPQAAVARKIDGIGYFGRAGFPDVRDVQVGPDDLRAVVVVEVLYALAGVARNLAQRVHGIGENS